MDRGRSLFSALLCALAVGAVLPGCGSGGGASTGTPRAGADERSFGVYAGQPASRVHLARADCASLARFVRRRTDDPVVASAEPSPPLSRCRLTAPGMRIAVYLDAAHEARRRYANRMVEQVQFNAPDAARLPHPVAGVGDPSAGEHNASWIPAYSTLFAVRGNRFLTVAYSDSRLSRPGARTRAAALARRAFRLSAR